MHRREFMLIGTAVATSPAIATPRLTQVHKWGIECRLPGFQVFFIAGSVEVCNLTTPDEPIWTRFFHDNERWVQITHHGPRSRRLGYMGDPHEFLGNVKIFVRAIRAVREEQPQWWAGNPATGIMKRTFRHYQRVRV